MTYRVVQWTTGKIGEEAVRGILAHPELELVGGYAFAADKIGRDVGELCGLGPIGVVATDDVEALLALAPDCVSYMPYRPDFHHVVRILESGVNIVTTLYMLSGWGNGDDVHERIVAAAEHGCASLLAGGIYPGHANNVAMALSAMCARVDCISLLESLELSTYENEKMFRVMGFDGLVGDPAVVDLCESTNGSFKDMVRVMANEMGVELDEVRFDVEFAAADRTLDFGFMTIGAGRIAGIKGVVSGKGWVASYRHPIVGKMDVLGLLFDFSETPGIVQGPPFVAGQDSRELLRELGIGDQQIDELVARRAVVE